MMQKTERNKKKSFLILSVICIFQFLMQAFIFDFDGVIVDSELYWDRDSYPAYKAMIPAFTEEHDRQLKGRNQHDIYALLQQWFTIDFTLEDYLRAIETHAVRIYERTTLIAGIDGLIDRLRERHIPIGIASSSERRWIEPVLERLKLRDAFPVIATAADVGVGKPNPSVYLKAAELLGADPAECTAFEDSTNGILAAKAAGMTCIALKHSWGYTQDLSAADVIVERVEDLSV